MESSTLNRGFTLVEMLVVLAIIGILTLIVISGQNNFNRSNLLNDAAYTVALSVRESQTLGLSDRISLSSAPNAGYGVHFGDSSTYYDEFVDTYPNPAATNNSNCPHATTDVNTPAARPGNCYEDLSQGEQVRRYTFSQGYTISKICGSTNNGTSWIKCSVPGSGDTLDVVYERPNTQAIITFDQATYAFNTAAVDVTSPQGGTRCVLISWLGQVSVSQTCP